MVQKTAKARLKLRRNTPAPPIKGNGQKRFVHSPLPEDKQLHKRIDFGAEGSPTTKAPKCKGVIFLANPQHGVEESLLAEDSKSFPKNVEHETSLICFVPTIPAEKPPDSGHIAGGGEKAADEKEDNLSGRSRPKDDGHLVQKESW